MNGDTAKTFIALNRIDTLVAIQCYRNHGFLRPVPEDLVLHAARELAPRV
jgi:hypothetical protein